MKRTLALLLVFAMLVCMVPAFSLVSTAAEELVYGLNADFYQMLKTEDNTTYNNAPYSRIIGTATERGPLASFEDTQRFDASIEQLMDKSIEVKGTQETGLTDFGALMAQDGYIYKWTGTITAKADGTYWLVGNKIDNGFVAFVKQDGAMKKVFEYWTTNHWFDTGEDYLYSNNGSFTLKAGVATEVEFWYYESDGGEALNMMASLVENGGAENAKALSEYFTFNLDKTCYASVYDTSHDSLNALIPAGATPGNGSDAASEGNHHYSAELLATLKSKMEHVGSAVVPNYESEAFVAGDQFHYYQDDGLIEYNGYVTVTTGGEYTFGTREVDNCLFVEYTDLETDETFTVYEFFASGVWNDSGETYYSTSVTLEEGKTYKVHAVYVEIDGGQAITSRVIINDDIFSLADAGLVYTTTLPSAPVGPVTQKIFDKGSEWYYMTSGVDNDQAPASEDWMTNASVYAEWDTANADFGSAGTNVWETNEASSMNSGLWVVKEFTIDNIKDVADWAVMTEMFFDDNITVYLNGSPVFVNGGWNEAYTTYKLAEQASSLLKTGTNTIAASLYQGHGGYAFDMSLYVTKADTSAYAASIQNIATADQLLAFVTSANANPAATKGQVVSINADIDMTGKTWTALTTYYGLINGNGHKISNISYAPSASAIGAHEGTPVGILVNVLGNLDNVKGQIKDLTLDNCTLTVTATEGAGKEEWVYAGGIAGLVDRGYISDCTVSNTTIKGSSIAGGVVGIASYAFDGSGVYVMDCGVDATIVEAKQVAGGIIGYARGADTVMLGEVTIGAGTQINAPVAGDVNGSIWYGDVENMNLVAVNYKKTLSVESGKDFSVYTQKRVNADDETLSDYRVVIVAKTSWLRENYYKGFKVEFGKDGDTKSFTAASTTAFKTVTATTDSGSDVYEAVGDTVVFGWVVTEVPEGYTPTSVTLANLTLPD